MVKPSRVTGMAFFIDLFCPFIEDAFVKPALLLIVEFVESE